MQVDDFIRSVPRTPFNIPRVSWLSGAAAGIRIGGKRSPGWLWDAFFNDVAEMIQLVGDVEPVVPGYAPDEGDGLIGSAFDALGGYISVTGEITPEGLYFRVPVRCQKHVKELLNGITIHRSDGEIIVPDYDMPAFLRLIPIEGPLAEWLEQEEIA
jgi:hypothetical protein